LQHLAKKSNKKESAEGTIPPTSTANLVITEEDAQKQLKDKTNQASKFSMNLRRVFGASSSVTNKVEVRDF